MTCGESNVVEVKDDKITVSSIRSKFLPQGDLATWDFTDGIYRPNEFEILRDSEEGVYNELIRQVDHTLGEANLSGQYDLAYVTYRYGNSLVNSVNSIPNNPDWWVGYYSVLVKPTINA